MSPKALVSFAFEKDQRLLFMCLIALATGRTRIQQFKPTNAMEKSSILSIYMATDLVVRSVQPRESGPAVKCASNMFRHASESRSHDFLSSCRVVVSPGSSIRDDARNFITACLEPEETLDPRDLVMTIEDNVNWKIVQEEPCLLCEFQGPHLA